MKPQQLTPSRLGVWKCHWSRSPRAGWILCAAHSAPEEGERRASAGAREGRCSPQWASRCPGHGGAAASSPSGGRPPDGAGGGGPRLQGWGSGGFPWKTLGQCLLRKPNDNPKKENEGWKVFHVNGNDRNRSCSTQTKWPVKQSGQRELKGAI